MMIVLHYISFWLISIEICCTGDGNGNDIDWGVFFCSVNVFSYVCCVCVAEKYVDDVDKRYYNDYNILYTTVGGSGMALALVYWQGMPLQL